MYLLDTCVLSELASRRPAPSVVGWIDSVEEPRLFISVITVGEIRKGIARLPESRKKAELEAWFAEAWLGRFQGRILPLDEATMMTWGELTARMERGGRPLPAIDSLIAATTLHHELTLVTRNEKDFEGAGLDIVNPWK